jgi:phosphonate transport system substrate-binding protein
VTDLRGLEGKTMDFPAPNALAASLMTRAQLSQLGVTVKPRYVKTHGSVYLNVALGLADAGGGVLQTLAAQPPEVREQLRVIETKVAVASHPVVASSRVSKAVREQVRVALLALGESADGRALLARIPIDRVGQATPDDYLLLKHLGLEKFYVPN